MIAWAETRMTEIDLAAGLESLAQVGYVRLEASVDGPVVRLLDDGFGIPRPRMNDHQILTWLRRLRQARELGAGSTEGLDGGGCTEDFAQAM